MWSTIRPSVANYEYLAIRHCDPSTHILESHAGTTTVYVRDDIKLELTIPVVTRSK